MPKQLPMQLFDAFSGAEIAEHAEKDTVVLEIDSRLLEPAEVAKVEATLNDNPCLVSVIKLERNGGDPYAFVVTKQPDAECTWRVLYSALRDAISRNSAEAARLLGRPIPATA